MEALIGRKLGMTQIFEETGEAVPVSVIQVGPCPVVQVKTPERDGYAAIQIGFDPVKPRRVTKPLTGHFKKVGLPPHRVLKEVRVEDPTKYKPGDTLDVRIFEGANRVHVTGVTKGRGYAGAMKRHGFKGGKDSHGGNKIHRAVGSIGNCATPSRVFKGKKLPGRMGGERMTVKNLEIVRIDPENHLLFVRGAVPGARNGIVFVRKA
jgi:large subunit ribosomal protein L3